MISALPTTLLLLSTTLPLSHAADTILGVYMFHRHGDRTAKALAPANLTDLGYAQVYNSGQYYRNRYIDSSASYKIAGMNTDLVKQAQISVTAPADTVLQNSATGFLQGLYPPVGSALGTQTLRNGSNVTAPMDGYQLIPVGLTSTGQGSEDNGWLQDASDCGNAEVSSNDYFLSSEYQDTLDSTRDFYESLVPVVNGTFAADDVTFKNAYTVFDLINVAEIHNATINSSSILTPSTLHQTLTLASTHEYNLAYNASSPIRAIVGMQLAAEILSALNTTITTSGSKQKLTIQFGAYATFFSFFGLADLPPANPDFYGIPEYASAMMFELFTPVEAAASFPSEDDLYVRFLYHNGTTSADSEPVAYPLFGGANTTIPWTAFVSGMQNFAVGSTEKWCSMCGNTTGSCAPYADAGSGSSSGASSAAGSDASGGAGHGISTAVGGVIGAMVTLAVVLGLEALVMLVGGFRLAKRGSVAAAAVGRESVQGKA
ncbi:phosphoglycerate mutase-like protein [Saccharata proteae CBS 121410]|uniref:Phosphoglycerate mutase-like protein n=1 Tax=Saccharata proteae CBS 121410 TaxID=1314787 RepID=A0A9P4LVI9_9PEZI|nr:phosphoglycerate mutase-like protein [Saccharata proteae CBS 121410]